MNREHEPMTSGCACWRRIARWASQVQHADAAAKHQAYNRAFCHHTADEAIAQQLLPGNAGKLDAQHGGTLQRVMGPPTAGKHSHATADTSAGCHAAAGGPHPRPSHPYTVHSTHHFTSQALQQPPLPQAPSAADPPPASCQPAGAPCAPQPPARGSPLSGAEPSADPAPAPDV